MTRFSASSPKERQLLFGDAIAAHRERDSDFLTVEADADATDEEHGPPWVQFADGTINLDCTDEELDRLKDLLNEFPAFKIDDLQRPEDAEGTNVRVTALADQKRIAEFVDRLFRDVYGQAEGYTAWVTAV